MDNLKNIIVGGAITLLIGGTAYTFTQEDVVNNLSKETGLTEQQATDYVNSISEEDLATWDEIGNDYITESGKTLVIAADIDCDAYEYEWESPTLTCTQGKAQLEQIAATEKATGEAYVRISVDTATEDDIRKVIEMIDKLNADYDLEIMEGAYEDAVLQDIKMSNSYNKSLLKAALESEQ
jgi:hypothetical protein